MEDLDFMNDIIFNDCEYRYLDDDDVLSCKNKQGADIGCDNCQEKTVFNDADLSRKWSN